MTVSLLQLWMPILLSTVLAWVASAAIHMVFKYHNSDYRKLPNETELATTLRAADPEPGFYSFPYCVDMAEMQDEAMQQRFKDGPVGFVTVLPSGLPNMGKLMAQQVAFYLLGALLIAYCAALALAPGAGYGEVFRFVSAVGFLTFGWAIIPFSIWYGHPWSTTAKYLLDALIYALLAAGAFGWLWPAGAAG